MSVSDFEDLGICGCIGFGAGLDVPFLDLNASHSLGSKRDLDVFMSFDVGKCVETSLC